jgi:phosphatidylinositol 3-kinase
VEAFHTCLARFTEAVFCVSKYSWNEWVTLPVMFSDLPRNAQLALTIYDAVGPSEIQPVGGTTISLFGKHGVFRQVLYCFTSCK